MSDFVIIIFSFLCANRFNKCWLRSFDIVILTAIKFINLLFSSLYSQDENYPPNPQTVGKGNDIGESLHKDMVSTLFKSIQLMNNKNCLRCVQQLEEKENTPVNYFILYVKIVIIFFNEVLVTLTEILVTIRSHRCLVGYFTMARHYRRKMKPVTNI